MERLKTRQRLEKMNTLGSPTPLVFNEVRNEPEDNVNNSHLASKIRVNSLINQSIPDMVYAPKKIKSHITAKDLEDFQKKENEPIEINGKLYRMHPASIPEPTFDEEDQVIDIQTVAIYASQLNSSINEKLSQIAEAELQIPIIIKQMEQLEDEYNSYMSKPPLNLLDKGVSIFQLTNYEKERKKVQDSYDIQRLELEQRFARVSRFIDNTQREIDVMRKDLDSYEADLPTELALNEARKVKNKAKVKAYEENLKLLNRNFNLVQEVGESDEDYIARIKSQTEAVEDPNLLVDRFNLYEARRFRENLKEIIRDNSVIETAYNTLYQEDDSFIPEVNKIFALVKSRYEKLYGTFQLSDKDLIKFLKQLIENPEETIRKAEEEDSLLTAMTASAGDSAVDFTAKYRALNQGKRYKVPDLVQALQDVKDYVPDGFAIDVGGKTAVLTRGSKGGLNVEYNKKIKATSQTPKPVLIAIYVAILEVIKQADPTVYEELNTAINSKTNYEYGEGLGIPDEPLPKSCKLGKIDIDLNKLFYKNILSVKQNGLKINGVRNTSVSDEFVKIIMDLCKAKYPTTKDLNKLNIGENQTFDALLYVAGLHKRIEHTANKSVQNLKNRLTLIEGEISAGNTNDSLFTELRDIVYKLHHLGEITGNSATEYLKQLKR